MKWSYLGWYVGIKKSGKPKKGSKTWYPPHQKAIQFVAKKQSSSQPFPDNFDFGNENGGRVRREAVEESNMENTIINATSTSNNINASLPTNGSNNSPILFIDDENGGSLGVVKTTAVDKVVHNLPE